MIEISKNLKINYQADREMVTNLSSEVMICGGLYMTLVLPEHVRTFQEGVRNIMGGITLKRAAALALPDGQEIYTSIFGHCDSAFTTNEGEHTQIFVPSIVSNCLPLVEGNLNQALHGYHARLIGETNATLHALESPYRLAPLPPAADLV